jgi:hypothetical protein
MAVSEQEKITVLCQSVAELEQDPEATPEHKELMFTTLIHAALLYATRFFGMQKQVLKLTDGEEIG